MGKQVKNVVKIAKKAWKNKYIRAGLIIAAIATGVGAFAVAGASGVGIGAASAATGLKGASAFGALMKAGFVGAAGTAGTTAGLLGAGGKFALGSSILAGGSAITPTASLAGTIPTTVTPATGLFSASTPLTAPASFTTASGGFSSATPLFTGSSFTGGGALTTSSTLSSAGSFGLSGATSGGFSVAAPTLTPALGAAKTGTAITKAVSTTSKSGFLGKIKNTLKDGIYAGVKNLAAQGTYNLIMHGDVKGPDFEQDIPYVSGNSSGYYSGTYALPDAIKFTNANLGSDTIGSTYVNMLKNLNYGTGSLDYARHTNMALMRGIQVPQIQYA